MSIGKNQLKMFFNRRHVLYELVKKGITLKYRRSYLGMLWTLLEPILSTIVLTLVFGTILGNRSEDFPVYILCGRLLYSFFSSSTKTASRSIRANAAIIKKVYVPKYLYPFAAILQNYITFLISLVVLPVLAIYCRVGVTKHIIQVVIPLVFLLMLTVGVSLILATICVFIRDIEYLWDVLLMLVMYSSAIFYYPEKLLASDHAWILRYNPIYCSIQLFRDGMFGEALNLQMTGYLGLVSIVVLVIGVLVFYWKQDEFILYI